MKNKIYLLAIVEMILLISMSVSFSYLINENNFKEDKTEMKKVILEVLKIFLSDKNFVSAETGTSTCLESKDGRICQEYSSSTCSDECTSDCIPARRNTIEECRPGTCYDSFEGTCQAGSPKYSCEMFGGQWFNDPYENIPECQEGCCVLGSQTSLISEQQCQRKADSLGLNKDFRPEIGDEISCLNLAETQEEGACIFDKEGENGCKFGVKSECLVRGGKFYADYLCSNLELNTTCKKQASVSCVEGKDEVYWFDSCGNRENIYSTNLVESWNDGKKLSKEDSCVFNGDVRNCGNCNYLTGSKCSEVANIIDRKDKVLSLLDVGQEAYCKNMNCEGAKNGESWCVYQTSIGVDSTGQNTRSTDTPGSRHFREVCINGDLRIEPCADYRNEICVEENANTQNGVYRGSACRPNRWQECLAANNLGGTSDGGQMTSAGKSSCESNPDCFVKSVVISDKFKFDYCTPRYPPGFDFGNKVDTKGNQVSVAGGTVCSTASQECTVLYVKKLSGWKCEANCECETPKFTEELHDFCMSLGDCGASVNQVGVLTENYQVSSSDSSSSLKLSSTYLNGLKKYANPVAGKKAIPGEAYGGGPLGIPPGLGQANYTSPTKESLDKLTGGTTGQMIGAVAGLGGMMLKGGGSAGAAAGASSSMGPSLAALGSSAFAALAGAAAVAMVLQSTGVSNGIDPALAYGLIAVGGLSAGIIQAGGAIAGGALVPFAWAALIAVIIFILVMILSGVGKTKEVKINFQCLPWQPPTGGKDCSRCGEKGLPCSKYSCSALGQTCALLNEGMPEAECVNLGQGDASSPIISAASNISSGYKYEKINNGIRITSENGGCVKSLSEVTFGISLNEPGQCKMDITHKKSYDEMSSYFGGRNLFVRNHSMTMLVPTLQSLGVSAVGPEAKTEYSFYVRCMDGMGNKNIDEFTVNFCISPEKDVTSPVIIAKDPAYEYVQSNITSSNISIYTNEPAECKWSIEDVNYDLMNQSFTCENKVEDRKALGWRCSDIIDLSKNESKYFVRCKDQPWEQSEDKRNKNTKSYELSYKKSKKLEIVSVEPNNMTIVSSTSPTSVSVTIRTAGGVDGSAVCEYMYGGRYIPFFETYAIVHKQVFESFEAGSKSLPVRCTDRVGNVAERELKFKVEIDRNAPKITRVYEEGDALVVVTGEEADCYYSTISCTYGIENASLMYGSDIKHSLALTTRQNYYIKCIDERGNRPGGCSIIVSPSVKS